MFQKHLQFIQFYVILLVMNKMLPKFKLSSHSIRIFVLKW